MNKAWYIALLVLLTSAATTGVAQAAEQKRDVVFIVLDDLNDWVGVLGGHPQSETPHIDALLHEVFCSPMPIVMRRPVTRREKVF